MSDGAAPIFHLQHTPLPWKLDPIEAFQRFPIDRPLAMLHSGRLDLRWARYSILASPVAAYRFIDPPSQTPRSQWIGPPPADSTLPRFTHDPLEDLHLVTADDPALYLGYLSYDLARFIEILPSLASSDRDWPIIQFQRCPGWLIHNRAEDRWYAAGNWPGPDMPDLPNLPPHSLDLRAAPVEPDSTRHQHEANVARAIEYIAAGDIFQVNLAQRFTANIQGSPRALFSRLAKTSPAWFGAYIELLSAEPDEPRRSLISTSPELFLSLDANRRVTTRPIKGTRPASAPAKELALSEKDAAELHMIVDLMRNDLGKVCRFGSVRVAESRTIESHPTVHHGVATVTGTLRDDRRLIDLLRAAMPGGSITGAPKVRAMQIIEELEPHRRGPYCGAIGYIHQQTAGLSIAIRTLLAKMNPASDRGRVDFSVGGGIVADSKPRDEYQETLDKAAAMMTALSQK